MVTSVPDGSLERFRSEAKAIHDGAEWRIFGLLFTASLSITSLYVWAVLALTPESAFRWPVLVAFVLICLVALWTVRTRRVSVGIALLSTMMVAGVSGVIAVQRGAHAPALVYGLATIAVVFVAGRGRLGWSLALALTLWTIAVSWAATTGRWAIDAPNPLGVDNARLLAYAVAVVLIGLAARVEQQRRHGLDALLERALRLTEGERDQAQSLAERRARAVAEIGHEIRTPMTGIVGASQLLARQPLSPVQRQLLSIQRQSAERLLHLVTALLDEAKAQSGQPAAVATPFAVRVLIAEVCELFAAPAHRKGVELIWTADPSIPQTLLGDALRLRQVLSNLVSNAVKFTDHGSVRVRLLRAELQRLRIEVRDTGRGVTAERQEVIFERFVSDASGAERAHSTGLGLPICRELARAMGGHVSVASEPGVGSCFTLDLPCAPAPMGAGDDDRARDLPHAGRLWVLGASEPLEEQLRFLLGELDVEARFVDRWPGPTEWEQRGHREAGAVPRAVLVDIWIGHGRCAEQLSAVLEMARQTGTRVIAVNSVAQDAALGVLEDVWQVFRPPNIESLREALDWAFGPSALAAPKLPAGSAPMQVLLVDDNPVNRLVGKAMLETIGVDVVAVEGGRAAVDAALQRQFDLVLMDLQMPEMDGIEATRRLREDAHRRGLPRTPVVAATGHMAEDVDARCRDAGIDAVLVKPYTVDQLRAAVELHAKP